MTVYCPSQTPKSDRVKAINIKSFLDFKSSYKQPQKSSYGSTTFQSAELKQKKLASKIIWVRTVRVIKEEHCPTPFMIAKDYPELFKVHHTGKPDL